MKIYIVLMRGKVRRCSMRDRRWRPLIEHQTILRISYILFSFLFGTMLFAITSGTLKENKIYESDSTQIEFSFNVIPKTANVLKIPKVRGLTISGPQQSRQTTIVNGSMSQSFKLIFTISPERYGRFHIPPIIINIDGVKYESAQEILTVVKGTNPTAHRRSNVFNPFARIDPQYSKIGRAKGKLLLTNMLPYQGEVFGAYYVLGLKNFEQPAINFDQVALTDFKDIYSELYKDESKSIPKIDFGLGYNIAIVPNRYLIVALTSGEHKIPGRKITVSDNSNIAKPGVAVILPINIKVRPLPEKDKPVNFSGNVGDFKFHSYLVEKDITYSEGKEFNVALEVTGNGNFIYFTTPELLINSEFFTVTGKKEISRKYNKNPLSPTGTILVHYKIVAIKKGNNQLGKFKANWFNATFEKYQSIEISLPKVNVLKGSISSEMLKSNEAESRRKKFVYLMPIIWFVLILIFILFFTKSSTAIKLVARLARLIQPLTNKVLIKVNKKVIIRQELELLKELSLQICGHKQGIICEEYLKAKGVDLSTARKFSEMKNYISSSRIETINYDELETVKMFFTNILDLVSKLKKRS